MPKRLSSWQLAKARTAKGLRELPKCATQGCTGRALGYSRIGVDDGAIKAFRLLCPKCAWAEQRAQRERRT